MRNVEVTHTAMADRREQATDQRGLPASFSRALEALKGNCAHCDQRAIVSSGAGVGLCSRHQGERRDRDQSGVRLRERARRAIDMAKRGL
jgi:hypothetical protein